MSSRPAPAPRDPVEQEQTPALPDTAALLRRVVEAAHVLSGAAAAAILLFDPERDRFVPGVASGLDERWRQGRGLDVAQALARRAAQDLRPVALQGSGGQEALDEVLLAGGRRAGAVWAAPLVHDGRVVGVLQLYHEASHPASMPAEAMDALTALAGSAIVAAQAHARERSRRNRLEALDGASKALAGELSLHQLLQRIVELAARLAGARYGALGVAGADGYLTDFITTGLRPEERARIGLLPRGHGLLGVLIRQGQPLRVPDIGRDPRRVGFPPHHPPMTSLLGVPIRVRERVVGDLYLTDKVGAPAFSAEDQQLIELLAAHAGIAIENARLHEQVREVTRLRERERIARDLHDGIIQNIYAVTLQLEDIAEELPAGERQERLLGLADALSAVIGDIRTYIQGLRARELGGRLLAEGVAALVREVEGRTGLALGFALAGEPYRLPDALANTVLQVAREALANVVKHARARRARVELTYAEDEVRLEVADDGQGFDPGLAVGAEHHGLRNMRERAGEVGGALQVQSQPGAGTTLTLRVPARRADGA